MKIPTRERKSNAKRKIIYENCSSRGNPQFKSKKFSKRDVTENVFLSLTQCSGCGSVRLEYPLRVREVASSNLVIPTFESHLFEVAFLFLALSLEG